MFTDLVEKFCTIPKLPITSFDTKAISSAKKFEIISGKKTIQCYEWGEGKTLLLTHGWGSRASHMVPLAKQLSEAGFRVVAFDAPGHSSINEFVETNYSSMFEFCMTIAEVGKKISPVYAFVGYSLGAASSAIIAAGQKDFKDFKIDVEKLVLVSTPKSISGLIKSFCRNNDLSYEDAKKLEKELQHEFNFSIDDYLTTKAVKMFEKKILLIHDNDDEEVPIGDAVEIAASNPAIKTFFSNGYGHSKILINRNMFAEVKNFLLEN
jgi:pimeloyl-ACP methyl ester carboxylesterase